MICLYISSIIFSPFSCDICVHILNFKLSLEPLPFYKMLWHSSIRVFNLAYKSKPWKNECWCYINVVDAHETDFSFDWSMECCIVRNSRLLQAWGLSGLCGQYSCFQSEVQIHVGVVVGDWLFITRNRRWLCQLRKLKSVWA